MNILIGIGINVLTERQRQVVYAYFWKEKTQEEIGKELGVSQRGVGKIIENSLKILRKCVNYDEYIENMGF